MKEHLRAAKKFREYWLLANDFEVAGYQKYWISLLGDVLGVDDALLRIKFQIPVPTGRTTKFLDAWIPETKVLIEHKKRGIKLDLPQSGHDGMTPYEQAVEYDNARGYEDKARWIVTCNFDEIWIYDRSCPLDEPQKITLSELPKEVHRLAFLVKSDVQKVDSMALQYWGRDLDCAIIAGCAVLDVRNYRFNSLGLLYRWKHKDWKGVYPGEIWEGVDVKYLLGYALKAPLDADGGDAITAAFIAHIKSGKDIITSWRDANNTAKGRNACVVDCSKTPHQFWFWDESSGSPIWTKKVKGSASW